MALILIIIGLVISRSWKGIEQFRNTSWFEQYSQQALQRVQPHLTNPTTQLLAVLAIPVIVIMIFQEIAAHNWLSPVWLLISLALLLYCLGSFSIETQIDQLIEALEKNDTLSSNELVASITGAKPAEDLSAQLEDTVSATLLTLNQHLFSIIFWFALLGPVGAVIYRLNQLIATRQPSTSSLHAPAQQLQGILDWLPLRLLAISFGFAGHFEGALHAYHERSQSEDINKTNLLLIVDVANGAMHGTDSSDGAEYLRALRGLILRGLIIWLAAIAIITLIGWG